MQERESGYLSRAKRVKAFRQKLMKQLEEEGTLDKLEAAKEKGLLRPKDKMGKQKEKPKEKKPKKGTGEALKKKTGDEGKVKKKSKFVWVEGLHQRKPKKDQKDQKDQKDRKEDKKDKKEDKEGKKGNSTGASSQAAESTPKVHKEKHKKEGTGAALSSARLESYLGTSGKKNKPRTATDARQPKKQKTN